MGLMPVRQKRIGFVTEMPENISFCDRVFLKYPFSGLE